MCERHRARPRANIHIGSDAQVERALGIVPVDFARKAGELVGRGAGDRAQNVDIIWIIRKGNFKVVRVLEVHTEIGPKALNGAGRDNCDLDKG